MNSRRQRARVAARTLGLIGVLGVASLGAQETPRGKAIYDKWCLGCHGEQGDGLGSAAAFMLPRPRDFTGAVYQIRTTASGELPTDQDLRRVMTQGLPGTAMPGWTDVLSGDQIDEVIAYVKGFSRFFEGGAPEKIAIGKQPRPSAEGLDEGRQTYQELECFRCHGQAGRGNGTSAPTLTDDTGFPIRPADLTENWLFNGGGTVDQIYLRMRTGLDGTPMPSNSDVIDAGIITDEQLWRVAQYVRSLSPDKEPQVQDVIRAYLREGSLPAGPSDTAWSTVERFYVPLVGQIIVKPRWFAPMVDGVWVQAAHDGERLALRLSWDEPSQSPDPAWDEWLENVQATVTDVDGALPETQGPDRFLVQFPLRPEAGAKPYFLGGDTRRPVSVWSWTSRPDRAEEGTATGLGTFVAVGGQGLTHEAEFDDGQWRLQLTRPLAATDTATAPSFPTGQAIPIAFFAADGSNGEGSVRGSASSWTAVYLDVPTPATVYITPVLAIFLTAGLGLMVVWRAQGRERLASRSTLED